MVAEAIAPPRAEVQEAWAGLLDALARAGYAVDELVRPGAAQADVAAAQQAVGRALPADLAGLYQLADGQTEWYDLTHGAHAKTVRERGRWACALFGDGWGFDPVAKLADGWRAWQEVRSGYTPQELAKNFDRAVEVREGDPVQGLYTSPDWIGFATDGGGNQLAVDLTPAPGGRVGQVIVIGADEDLRRVIAPGVVELLELCVERLAAVDPAQAENGVLLYELEPS
ncbi:SMI1/KNR4 family protein [Kineosporia sp. J2-2]|uniref:SMI1/KNR4 family protein n=1 Tax=Kineosporia corallincola TaxID=2835133 RepID=A0ABS5TB31_9ACTN|nr:SMI1/KNR4 family protein [Kineosporia corallincola]MBT0768053.1 SMI1/KNR4 family protein [Kineosporia corallincola]